jgi:hypothetical protein
MLAVTGDLDPWWQAAGEIVQLGVGATRCCTGRPSRPRLALRLGDPPRAPWNRRTLHPALPAPGIGVGTACSWPSSAGPHSSAAQGSWGCPPFLLVPHPLADVGDDGLPALVDGDVLHLDGLLTTGARFLVPRHLLLLLRPDRSDLTPLISSPGSAPRQRATIDLLHMGSEASKAKCPLSENYDLVTADR